MSHSRARLIVEGGRLVRASASLPQRWNRTHRAADGWTEVIHQLVGDGLFGGDRITTSIAARGRSSLAVRSIAATALRGCQPAAACVRLSAMGGARLIYLPGALLPQRSSDSSHALQIDADGDSAVLAASIVLPGRLAMGEWAAFQRLRLRTTARFASELAFAEDAEVVPSEVDLDGPAMLAGATAVVSFIALGYWAPGDPGWWDPLLADATGVVGGAGRLRTGGVLVRALCADLGSAAELVHTVEAAARQIPPVACPRSGVC